MLAFHIAALARCFGPRIPRLGTDIFVAPIFAPKERDVYSPETLERRRSARNEMFPVI